MLRVDPSQRPRLVEIIRNLIDRIAEARLNGWLGEVQALQVALLLVAGVWRLIRKILRGWTQPGEV
jgi:hypothetical protein